MKKRTNKRLHLTLFVLGVVVLSGEVLGAERLGDDKLLHLETVYVDALRQKKDNQQLPISVALASEAQFKSGEVSNTLDLGLAISGLTASQYGGTEPQYFIRGIGSTATSAGEDHSVIVFNDGAYAGRNSSTALTFLDLERIEILKGPQGTLFGRNAVGGVIQLVQKKPSLEREGELVLGVGDDQQKLASFAAGGALTKHSAENPVSARVSLAYESIDGDVTNLTTGASDLRENEDFAIRLQLMQGYGDRGSIRFSAEYAENTQVGASPRKSSSPNSPVFAGGFIPVPQPNDNLEQVTLSIDGYSELENRKVSLHAMWDFGFTQFESITAWRKNEHFEDQDVSAVGLILLEVDEETELQTQEFLFKSPESSDLSWTAGMFFLREQIDRIDVTDLTAISDLVNLNPVVVGLPPGAVIPGLRAEYIQEATNTSSAIFGEVDYPFSDSISALIGLRYSYDDKELDVNAIGFDALDFGLLAEGPYAASVNQSFNDLSGRASVQYSPNDNIFSYLQYSQAYKSGGFDGTASSLASLESGFEPEQADSIEWGFKSEWLDNRLRFNAALFFTGYENLQVFQVTNNGTTISSNAAEAEIQGFEFDLNAKLNEGLSSQLSCTFLDAEYEAFISDVDDDFDMQPDDLSGNTLTRSPEYSCRAAFQWQPLFKNARPLLIGLSYAYQDDIFITPQNRPLDTIEAYGVAHLHMRYQLSEQLTISSAIRNATDEEYKLHTFDADPLVRNNIESSVYARGRTWSANMRYEF